MKKFLIILFILVTFNFGVSCAQSNDNTFLSGKIESAEFLKGANDFVLAVVQGDAKEVERFLKLGVNPDEKFSGLPVIFFATHFKYEEIFDLLLQYGANPDTTAFGESVLKYSIYRSCIHCVSSLVEYKANLNKKSMWCTSPLNFALQRKEKEISGLLLKNGATPTKKSYRLMKKLEY